MSIRARKLKSGRTVYDAYLEYGLKPDGSRDRRKKTFKTKKAAQLEEARVKTMREAMRNKSGKILLADYLETYYLPDAKKRLAVTSYDTYSYEIKKRILPALGNLYLSDISRREIQGMLDTAKTYAPAKKSLDTIKTILNEARSDGFILNNPAQLRYTLPPKGSKRDSGLVLATFEQIREFADYARQNAPESVIRLVMLGLYEGLRPEERYALDWSDVDIDNELITVRRAYVAAKGGACVKEPKTEQSYRTIPMGVEFAQWACTLDRKTGAFVTDGKMLSPSTAQNRYRKFMRDNPELPRLTMENMRHSFATAYLAAGGRVETLSRILGHSDINTTLRRYVKPDIESMRADILGTFRHTKQ